MPQKSILTFHKFFKERAHDIRLMEKSEAVSAPVVRQAKIELRDLFEEAKCAKKSEPTSILENYMSPEKLPTFHRLGLKSDMSLQERKSALKIDPWNKDVRTPWHVQLDDNLETFRKAMTKSAWTFRVGQLAEEYGLNRQWFPFFVTLTVDEHRLDPTKGEYQQNKAAFMKDGRAIKEWLRQMAEVSMEADGLNWRQRQKARRAEYFQYVRVYEAGKTGQHLHCHILMFLKAVPQAWKIDPNANLRGSNCTERRCKAAEGYWPYAAPQNRAVMHFRFANDIWTKLGHKWPADPVTGKGIDVMPATASGGYLAKYMGLEEVPGKRVGASKNAGMSGLRSFVDGLTVQELETCTANIPDFAVKAAMQHNSTVPWPLVRYLASVRQRREAFTNMAFDELIKPPPDYYKSMLHRTKKAEKAKAEKRKPEPPIWRLRTREELHNWFQECMPQERGVDPQRVADLVLKIAGQFPTARKSSPGIAGSRPPRF